MASNGWSWDLDQVNHLDGDSSCTNEFFYGNGQEQGLTKIFPDAGFVTLEFGNCGFEGTVVAMLDGVAMDAVKGNGFKTKIFEVKAGSVLEIKHILANEYDTEVPTVSVKSLAFCDNSSKFFFFEDSISSQETGV